MAAYSTVSGIPVGEMDTSVGPAEGTLDEPVKKTLLRDLKAIGEKMYYVMLPRARTECASKLRQWDLWGPMFLSLILAVVLWAQAPESQKKSVFSLVFIIVWIGSVVVTANAALLGGVISVFQGLCVLGYCLCPMSLASVICFVIPNKVAWIKAILLIFALYWSTGASSGFLSHVVPNDRRMLAVYPVWLFYASIGSLILLI